MSEIYLDYNATTPCDPRVVEKMLPYFNNIYGNPANGLHKQGRMASEAIEIAREKIALLINAQPNEVLLTSGATESNNLALLGVARINKNGKRKKIITSSVEHKSILMAAKRLEDEGFEIVLLPVDSGCRILLEAAQEAIDENTLLVSIQGANNEIGTIQPVAEIAKIAHSNGALMHCDAAQTVGKCDVSVLNLDVDLLSMSAHKVYGPKGVGGLFIRGGGNAIPIEPIWYGGGQENGLRSGTMNLPSIVGFGEACHICSSEMSEEIKRIGRYRQAFENELVSINSTVKINGYDTQRLPNTSNITFSSIDADALILNAPEIMIGIGSACTTGTVEPSHVLTAMGINRADASSSIRVSFGRFNDDKTVNEAVRALKKSYDLVS